MRTLMALLLSVSLATADEFVVTTNHNGGFVVTENLPSKKFVNDPRHDVLLSQPPLATADAAHTPMAEVVRVIQLLPKPQVAFVDFGCGYDARWCIVAAEHWGCKCVGIELDPGRAAAARERVRNLGLDYLITVIEGDAGTVEVRGDVAVAYLYPELLERLKPRLEYFKTFASYMHQVPGMPMVKNGDTWLYTKPTTQAVAATQPHAVWNGQVYYAPPNGNCQCEMCRSIRGQLAQSSQPPQPQWVNPSRTTADVNGHWVKKCYGRFCRMEWVAK